MRKKETCDKRPDCKWIQRGKSYTDEEGKEQTAGKEGICIPTVAQLPVLVAEHQRYTFGVFVIIITFVLCLMHVNGVTPQSFLTNLNALFEKKVEADSNVAGMAAAGLGAALGTTIAFINPAIGIAIPVVGVGAVGGVAGKVLTQTFAESQMFFDNIIFPIELVSIIIHGTWLASAHIANILGLYRIKNLPDIKSKVIAPTVALVAKYGLKYEEKVTNVWWSWYFDIAMMVLVVACPYLGAIGGSIFRAVKTFGNCFSKVQKAAMTREFNKTKKTITPGYLRPKKKPRKHLGPWDNPFKKHLSIF